MATKPTETLNFEPSGSSVEPLPTEKQAVGFLPAEKPPAQYLSWLFRAFSRLYNYVVDGNFTGNHTIAGTLGVSALVTASGGIIVPTAQAVTISGTTTLDVGTGAVTMGGTLGVTGNVTAPAYLTTAVRHENVGGLKFLLDSGTATRSGEVWTFPTSGTNVLAAAISLPPGTVISDIRWSCNRNSDNTGGQFVFALQRRSIGDGGITSGTVDSITISAGTGWASIDQSTAFTGVLPYTILSGYFYRMTVTASGTYSGAPSFDGARMAIDRA